MYYDVYIPEMSKIATVAKFVPIFTARSLELSKMKKYSLSSATESSSIKITVQLRKGVEETMKKSVVFV